MFEIWLQLNSVNSTLKPILVLSWCTCIRALSFVVMIFKFYIIGWYKSYTEISCFHCVWILRHLIYNEFNLCCVGGISFFGFFFIKITIWCFKQKAVFRILFLLQAKLRLINSYTNDCLVCLLTTARKRQQRVPFIWRLVTRILP